MNHVGMFEENLMTYNTIIFIETNLHTNIFSFQFSVARQKTFGYLSQFAFFKQLARNLLQKFAHEIVILRIIP